MGALLGCLAVKIDTCNNFQSLVHTVLVIILRSVSLSSIKQKYVIIIILCFVIDFQEFDTSRDIDEVHAEIKAVVNQVLLNIPPAIEYLR